MASSDEWEDVPLMGGWEDVPISKPKAAQRAPSPAETLATNIGGTMSWGALNPLRALVRSREGQQSPIFKSPGVTPEAKNQADIQREQQRQGIASRFLAGGPVPPEDPKLLQSLDEINQRQAQGDKDNPTAAFLGKWGPLGAGLLKGGTQFALGKLAKGVAERSPAAEILMKAGASKLTVGQQAPGSVMAQLEEAGQSSPIGRVISAQRQSGAESFQNAVANAAKPPGAPSISQGPITEQMEQLASHFNQAYEPIAQTPIPAKLEGVPVRQALSEQFQKAANDTNLFATDPNRNAVGSFLEKQLTALDASAPPKTSGQTSLQFQMGSRSKGRLRDPFVSDAGQTIPADKLIQLRSNIRTEIRKQATNKNPEAVGLFEKAEDAVTDALNKNLPPQSAQALRDLDGQYRSFKILDETVRRAGDRPGGFTPTELGSSIRQATPQGYSQGSGGPLRQLAAAGRETLDMRSPPTGARLLSLGPAARHVAPLLSAVANSPSLQPFVFGEAPSQQTMQRVSDALRRIKLLRSPPMRELLQGQDNR